MVQVKENGNASIDAYHYLHRNHLDSILVITNASGTVVEQTHLGAWGTEAQFQKNGQTVSLESLVVLSRSKRFISCPKIGCPNKLLLLLIV